MLYRLVWIWLILMVLAMPALAVGDDAPAWLQQAAAVRVPAYDKDVPAVILQLEQSVTLGNDGKITSVTTYAIRILTREGRAYAEAEETYLTNAGKVRDINAWLIRTNGDVKKYGKDKVIDVICNPEDIYDECRLKVINASNDADVGMVFGYQSTSEETPLFSQDRWSFQNLLPTLLSRYSLTLPSGWRATSVTFNHAKVEPVVTGTNYSWELRNLPPIAVEDSSPKMTNLVPRLAINYFPADGAAPAAARSFENWVEVSTWAATLHDPQFTPDEAIAAKTRQLTANAKTELERIRAIGSFVQELRYISIDIGVGRGNGYRPHPATQVFAKLYGDCKDKATLMRAMLSTINITSYPVVIYSGDRTYVREEWPSPGQFDHVIIAIKVGDETQAPTVVNHPNLGRLMFFDATDSYTLVGDLPDHEQGSLAVIVAGDKGGLFRMPIIPADGNRVDRQSEVVLDPDGSITVLLHERSLGQTAARRRGLFRGLSHPDFVGMIERWINAGANGAKITKLDPADNTALGGFALDVEFSASHYGQVMQDRLIFFRPAIIPRAESVTLTEPKRTHPIVLDAEVYSESVHVKLPVGFVVDELPDAVKLDAAFGSFTATYEVKEGQLTFVRKLVQRAVTIPVEDYAKAKTFFAGMRAVEQAPVVLARK